METTSIFARSRATKPKVKGKPRTPYFRLYYQNHPQKYLLSKQKHRAKLKANKPKKPLSNFLKKRLHNFLRCLDKHHIIVPILRFLKTKHPTIKN
jgi:hypothetical protein